MKPLILATTLLSSALFSGVALADKECVGPVGDWQPRETLRTQLEQQGWTIQRIKVDNGCYEVRGIDRKGNRFKATYAPASLQIQKLEIDFTGGGKASDYLDLGEKAPGPGQHRFRGQP